MFMNRSGACVVSGLVRNHSCFSWHHYSWDEHIRVREARSIAADQQSHLWHAEQPLNRHALNHSSLYPHLQTVKSAGNTTHPQKQVEDISSHTHHKKSCAVQLSLVFGPCGMCEFECSFFG